MFIFRLRLWLPLLSAAMLLGSVAVFVWSITASCRVELEGARLKPAAEKRSAGEDKAKLTLEDFGPLVSRHLQAPLFDPPPKKAAPVVKKEPPPPPVKLLATMPEPGGGCAMLSDADGTTLIKSLGDRITGGGTTVELVEIASDHIVLRQEDRLITLKLPK
jgi:hypothetical protein